MKPRASRLSLFSLALAGCAASPRPAPPSPHVRPTVAPPEAPPVALPLPEAREDGRLASTARPLSYALTVTVDPAQERYRGTVEVALQGPAQPWQHLVLHGNGHTLTSARLAQPGRAPVELRAQARTSPHALETEELVLSAPGPLAPGEATLTVSFERPFSDGLHGLYRTRVEGQWYAFTDFEPTDARRAWPCFDEPGFKVPWTVEVRTPAGLTVAANMPEASRATEGSEQRVRFVTTPPIASYLLALVVGPFDVQQGPASPVPIRGIAVRGRGAQTALALRTASELLPVLQEYFGSPYPYPKLDLVAVPEFRWGAMENPGLITFRDERLLLDERTSPPSERRHTAATTAHELAHQWFGNLVTMAWWNDLWLNEGFATWMEDRVLTRWRPELRFADSALRWRYATMALDALPSARAVRQPVRTVSEALEAFDGITYGKGASVLAMLERWVGEERFRTGVRAYLQAHREGNATAEDLFSALSTAAGRDVTAVARSFLEQPGVPLVRWSLDCSAGHPPTVRLSQSPYRPLGVPGEPVARSWRIPFCFSTAATPGAPEGEPRCLELGPEPTNVTLEGACPRVLDANPGETGYWLHALPPEVPGLLDPARVRALSPRGRIGLLADAWAMVRAGELGAPAALTLLRSLGNEQDRLVLSTAASVVAHLRGATAPASRAPVEAEVRRLFTPALRRLGYAVREGEPEESTLLRRELWPLLVEHGADAAALREASTRAAPWWERSSAVPQALAEVVVPLAARGATAAQVAILVARAQSSAPAFERSLALGALSQAPAEVLLPALDRALDAQRPEQERIPGTHLVGVVRGALGREASRAAVRSWLRAHLDALRPLVPSGDLSDLVSSLGDLCDAAELAEELRYWTPLAPQYNGGQRALDEGRDRAQQCAALRARLGQGAR